MILSGGNSQISRNRTTVGLKAIFINAEMGRDFGRNRTTVGLKAVRSKTEKRI